VELSSLVLDEQQAPASAKQLVSGIAQLMSGVAYLQVSPSLNTEDDGLARDVLTLVSIQNLPVLLLCRAELWASGLTGQVAA
jgi:hypothetical protein